MARPKIEGLSYFPLDADFFADRKIRALKGKYGANGILVYLHIICDIYRDKGYYLEFDEDYLLCLTNDLNISEGITRQIVKYLLSRSMLHEIKCGKLSKPVTIITAKSVQKRFQEAKSRLQRDVFVNPKYWILEESETLGFVKLCSDSSLCEINSNKSEINADKSAKNDLKESKVKENKTNEIKKEERKEKYGCILDKVGENSLLPENEYSELVKMSDRLSVDKYIEKVISWQNKSGKKCNNPYETIKSWIEKDGKLLQKKDEKQMLESSSFDMEEWENWALNLGLK